MSDVIPPRPDRPWPAAPDATLGAGAPLAPAEPGAPGGRLRSTWTWWEAVVVYVGCWIVASFATLPIFLAVKPQRVADIVASAAIAIVNVALLMFWLSRRHREWVGAIGFPSNAWPEIRAGVGFGLLLYPGIAFGVGIAVELVLQALSGQTIRTPDQVPNNLPPFGVVITILYAIVIAPIHEEFFFRGILFRTLRDRHGFAIGAVCSGLGFGLVHYIPAPFVDSLALMTIMVFTGFALAYLYDRRGNVVANMVAHATFNTIGLIFIFLIK